MRHDPRSTGPGLPVPSSGLLHLFFAKILSPRPTGGAPQQTMLRDDRRSCASREVRSSNFENPRRYRLQSASQTRCPSFHRTAPVTSGQEFGEAVCNAAASTNLRGAAGVSWRLDRGSCLEPDHRMRSWRMVRLRPTGWLERSGHTDARCSLGAVVKADDTLSGRGGIASASLPVRAAADSLTIHCRVLMCPSW